MASLGVWIIGTAGNVGACTVAGWAGLGAGVVEPIGLVTATEPFTALPLVGFDSVVFGGHETSARSLVEAVGALADEAVVPRAWLDCPEIRAGLAAAELARRPGIDEAGGWNELQRARDDLADFVDRHRLAQAIVLNVASTEPLWDGAPPPDDPDALFAALRGGSRLPASAIYAAAALDLGCGYVNFTPSLGSNLPGLHALAERRGAVHAGADGKTGQTLLKTALAPMFAIRRLPVRSWVSHNVLGNADGRALDDPRRRAAKQRSKGASLERILGYAPESRVHIEYVPSYGDWKVAWDRIVFEGFGGAAMSLELSWRGSDTALAAPLCIDLIRLVEWAQRRGERGVLGHLGVFFKDPMTARGGPDVVEHRLERQWQALLDHVAGDGAATS